MVDNTIENDTDYQYDWQNPNLKKFDFGRVMGRMFKGAIYSGRSFWLPVFILFGVPMFLIGLWPMLLSDGAYGDILAGGGFEGIFDVFTPVMLLIGGIIYLAYWVISAIIYVALAHNIHGYFAQSQSQSQSQSQPSLQSSMQRGLARLWVTIGASILFIIGVILGLLLFIVPGVLLLLGWYLMTPIIAMEDKGVTQTLSHAWDISKGSKRWILLFFIVLLVLSTIAQLIFSLIAMPFGNATLAMLQGGTTTFWILNSLGAALAQIVTLLLTVSGLTSIYYEIQYIKYGVVHEGLSAVFD